MDFFRKSLTVILFLLPISEGKLRAQPIGEVTFQSNDSVLTRAFNWAKAKALSYSHNGNDPVGYWYEAALPGRNAFCMRDVSHQSLGAAMLGLTEHNRNMFKKFAENISESKDWCSFWEINKYNNPAPVDYENDDDFWYNLPANFDVIYNCYRQFLWTGDSTYIYDPVFINFYERSLNEFVSRWQIKAEAIEKRERIINQRTQKGSRFYMRRGIPTYNEGGRGVTKFGVDLSAALVAGIRAYGEICRLRGDLSQSGKYYSLADLELFQMNRFWWDIDKSEYKSILYEDGSFDYFWVGRNQAFLHYLLYFDAVDKQERSKRIVDLYEKNHDKLIVELKTYLPMIFFEYGRRETAVELIKYLCSEENKRRDYPENSFTIIESFVRGLMGIDANSKSDEISIRRHSFQSNEWYEVSSLPVLGRKISIRHKGANLTEVSLDAGNPISVKVLTKPLGEVEVNGEKFPIEKDKSGTGFIYFELEKGKRESASIFFK